MRPRRVVSVAEYVAGAVRAAGDGVGPPPRRVHGRGLIRFVRRRLRRFWRSAAAVGSAKGTGRPGLGETSVKLHSRKISSPSQHVDGKKVRPDFFWLVRDLVFKQCKKVVVRHAARSGRGGTRRGVRSRPVRSPCVPRFVIFRERNTLARPRLHPDRRFGAVRRARLHHRDVVMARAPRRMSVSLVTGSGGVGGRPASRHRSRAREGSYGSRFDARTLRTRLGATQTPSAPCASGERVSRFRRRLLMKKIT